MNVPAWASLPASPTVVLGACSVLLGVTGAWAVWLVHARRRPAVSGWLLTAVAAFLGWGAWLVVNSKTHYDEPTSWLLPRRPLVSWLPGGVDVRIGALAWVQTAGVLLAGVALTDLARVEPVRRRLIACLAGVGGTVGALGALDRAGVGPLHFRQLPLSGTHFAVFEYHANAAAFLNLTLPAALVVAWRAWTRPASRGRRAAAPAALAGVLAGCATHVSKAGQVLGAVTLVAAAVAAWRSTAAHSTATPDGHVGSPRRRRVRWAVAAGVFAVAVSASGAAGAAERWRALPTTLDGDNPRLLVARVALRAVEQAPFAGSGPGSFKVLLPSVAVRAEPELFRRWVVQPYRRGTPTTMWMQAHDDPLQLLVEWGVPGLALALAVFAAPLVAAVGALRRRGTSDPLVVLAGTGALAIVGLHALVDFPLQVLPVQLAAVTWGAVVLGACRESLSGQADRVAVP